MSSHACQDRALWRCSESLSQNEEDDAVPRLGLLTKKQFEVLRLRGKGMSQLEAAAELSTTRANVSMIESRAKKKIERARETLRAFEATRMYHSITIEIGSRPQEIPMRVLREGDRLGVHIESNLVEIIGMVRSLRPPVLSEGRTSREVTFTFNRRGKLSVE